MPLQIYNTIWFVMTHVTDHENFWSQIQIRDDTSLLQHARQMQSPTTIETKLKCDVMRTAVPIPAVADASVSHSAAFGGSVVGVVGLL